MSSSHGSDPRRVVGAHVNTLATAVTHISKCRRLYGSSAKTKRINGIVQRVIVNQPASGRASWSLEVLWSLSENETKTMNLKSNRIKHGHVGTSSTQAASQATSDQIAENEQGEFTQNVSESQMATQTESTTIHDVTWLRENVTTPICGAIVRREWSAQMHDGNRLVEGCGIESYRLVDIFFSLFPMHHMENIVSWTSEKLDDLNEKTTSQTEVLRFFGILILSTRFQFKNRRDLWMSNRSSKYVPAANFGDTRMSRHRFDNLVRCITFSHCPESPGEFSSADFRWKLVDDFIGAFNTHRQLKFEPSETICVDESFSRWYGHGGSWIDKGLPHYVSLDRKPESGCEIQNSACGRSGVLLRLKLVKTVSKESVAAISNDLQHGTSVLCSLVDP